ncbi:hypothetical protein ISR92_03730 [Patescibacteria group bacterium]|nr:hypothetical protein [Patescibacteria group bacterium]
MRREFNLVIRALLFVAIAIGAWLMGMVIGQENAVTILNPNTSTANIRESGQPTVSMMLDYNNGDIDIVDNIILTSHANLWEAMLAAEEEGKLIIGQNEDWIENGLLWYGVNGFFNSSESRWYIWLNNDYVSELPDEINVKNGDILYFKYLSYYPR